ncbi:tandem-95 repeat protein [Vibrio kasasachensis]|uniref:tandem-95 repeat protein n=1 Tax=Vibrio kasasachensis TaxID=2910248 RepID=UPI003D0E9CF3
MGFEVNVTMGNLALGQTIVIDAQGNVRVLQPGQTPNVGEIVLQAPDGNSAVDGRAIDASLIGADDKAINLTDDIEQIFAALEDGVDPTQLGEEFDTAAGGELSSSNAGFESVNRAGEESIAETAFATQGLEQLGLSRTQSLSVLEQFRFALQLPEFVDSSSTPLGNSLSVTTLEDTALNGQLRATDANNDLLNYGLSEQATNGAVVVKPDGSWTYTPNDDYNGPDSFTVTVDDGNGGLDTLIINVGVIPVNDPPVFMEGDQPLGESISVTTKEEHEYTGKVQATDVDGDDLKYDVLAENQPDNGSVSIDEDGEWIYTPDDNYNGPDSFIIQVSDGNGGVDTVVVDVTVLAVAEMLVTTNPSIVEADDAYLPFTITLDEVVSQDVTLSLSLGKDSDGATSGIDYDAQLYVSDGASGFRPLESSDLVISAGQTQLEVFVKIFDDFISELAPESISLVAETNSEFVENEQADAQSKIIDEDGADNSNPLDAVKVTLTGPDSVMEGEQNLKFTVTLSDANDPTQTEFAPPGSVVTLSFSYTNADGDDITEVTTATVNSDGKTADFEIDTINDEEYEEGQEFTVSVVSITNDGDNVFEDMDLDDAHQTVAIDDSEDNPPKSEDFIVNLSSGSETKIVFNHDSKGSKDHISDVEDDASDIPLQVVITELPESGVLLYQGQPVTEGMLTSFDANGDVTGTPTFFNPEEITYQQDDQSTGFVLGVKDAPENMEGDESAVSFLNWGEPNPDNANQRILTFERGDTIVIESSGDLKQHYGDKNHIGYGIGVGNSEGIKQSDTITIDMSDRPAETVTLGLDGMGGWFEDGHNTKATKVEITITLSDGSIATQYVSKVTSGASDYIRVTDSNSAEIATFPKESKLFAELPINAPDGLTITNVELSTDGPGNWELRYLETDTPDDSFDYRAVDNDGNYSEESTVTLKDGENRSPIAIDDPVDFEVKLGTFNTDNNQLWSDDGATISTKYDGTIIEQTINENTLKQGVSGDQNDGPAAQIQFNPNSGQSEQFVIDLDKPADNFSFSVSNLFKNEGGTNSHEQGKWTAYLGGVAVASGVFTANEGNGKGTYHIETTGDHNDPNDLGGAVFDQVVFEAVGYSNDGERGADSSDYFITGFRASGDGSFAGVQGETLEIDIATLLGNDYDPDGDNIRLTHISEVNNNAEVWIDDSKLYVKLDEHFVGDTTFKYQITDDKGFEDNSHLVEATVNIHVSPKPDPDPAPGPEELVRTVIEAQSDATDTVTLQENGSLKWQAHNGSGGSTDVSFHENDNNSFEIHTGKSGDKVTTGDGSDLIYLGDSARLNDNGKDNAEKMFIDFLDSGKTQMSPKDSIDIAYAGGGNDTVYGEAGMDAIDGGSGDDKLYGGEGVDALRGGLGNDILTGGSEADIFDWNNEDLDGGLDTITDFNISEGDKIDLSNLLENNDTIDDLLANVVVGEDNVTITFGKNGLEQTIQLNDIVDQVSYLQPNGSLSEGDLSKLISDIMADTSP